MIAIQAFLQQYKDLAWNSVNDYEWRFFKLAPFNLQIVNFTKFSSEDKENEKRWIEVKKCMVTQALQKMSW